MIFYVVALFPVFISFFTNSKAFDTISQIRDTKNNG
jgi:hypothetical protein